MGLFGRKKEVEQPPVEDLPPLPTLETIHEEGAQTHHETPSISQQVNMPMFNNPPPVQKIPQPMPKPVQQMPVATNISPKPPQNLQPVQTPEPPQEKEHPVFAPLFVKIDRYRNILNVLGQLKTSIVMIRNSFATLNELEKARFETLKLIEEAVGKVETKLGTLDSELLRPSAHHTDVTPEYQDVETVNATVADLRGQIGQLKAELEQLS